MQYVTEPLARVCGCPFQGQYFQQPLGWIGQQACFHNFPAGFGFNDLTGSKENAPDTVDTPEEQSHCCTPLCTTTFPYDQPSVENTATLLQSIQSFQPPQTSVDFPTLQSLEPFQSGSYEFDNGLFQGINHIWGTGTDSAKYSEPTSNSIVRLGFRDAQGFNRVSDIYPHMNQLSPSLLHTSTQSLALSLRSAASNDTSSSSLPKSPAALLPYEDFLGGDLNNRSDHMPGSMEQGSSDVGVLLNTQINSAHLPCELSEEKFLQALGNYEPATPSSAVCANARFNSESLCPRNERPQGSGRAYRDLQPNLFPKNTGDEVADLSNQAGTSPTSSECHPSNHRKKPQRFSCPHPNCSSRSFGHRADRDRHVRKHSVTEKTFVCQKPGCGKKFYRKDKLLDHFRQGHRGGMERECSCGRRRVVSGAGAWGV